MSKNFLVIAESSKLIHIYSFPFKNKVVTTIQFYSRILNDFYFYFFGGETKSTDYRITTLFGQKCYLQTGWVTRAHGVIIMYQPLISVTLKNENIFLENIFLAHYIFGELTDKPFCFDQGFGKVIGFFYICASNHNMFHSIGLNSPSGQLC